VATEVASVRPLSSYVSTSGGFAVVRDVSPLSAAAGSTAAWMHTVPNARKKRITGEKFIFDVGLGSGVCWSPVSFIE